MSKRKIAVIDSETDPFQKRKFGSPGYSLAPFIWGYYDGDTFETFEETADLIDFLSERDEIVYCHNGGKFDFFFLASFIAPRTRLTVINGRLTRFKIGKCEFRDSFTILPVPLVAHDKGEIDYKLMSANKRGEHMEEITDYLYRDCHSLYNFVSRYIESFGMNLTLASGAIKQLCAIEGIKMPRTDATFYETFAPFYFGGRVEVFKPGIFGKLDGKARFKAIDINSAYPFAMLHNHPFGAAYSETTALPADRDELSRAFIRLEARGLGAFPKREYDGSLSFPDDGEMREFFITGHEFIAARETGALEIGDVLTVYRFPESINFAKYVNKFFNDKKIAKAASDKTGYLFAKLMQNAPYGKLGANPSEYEEFITCHPADLEAMHINGGYDYCEMFGDNAIMARPIAEHQMHFYNVATAGSITGFQRAELWRAICKCGGALYCDTDGIFSETTGSLEFGDEIGQWSIEADCDFGAFAAKKLYAAHTIEQQWPSSGEMNFGRWKADITKRGWKVSSKGVRLDESQIIAIAQGETIDYAQDAPTFSISGGTKWIDRRIKMRDNPNRAISH